MLTDIWRKTPFVSFLLVPGVLAIPPDQWDQATLDGALLCDTLGTFDSILILTGGGPGTETITPGLYSYQQAFQVNDWTVGATAAWCIAAAVLVVGLGYLLLMRRESE